MGTTLGWTVAGHGRKDKRVILLFMNGGPSQVSQTKLTVAPGLGGTNGIAPSAPDRNNFFCGGTIVLKQRGLQKVTCSAAITIQIAMPCSWQVLG